MKSLWKYILERADAVLVDNPDKGDIEPSNVSLKSFIPKEELNQKIWDNKTLRPEVVQALKVIKDKFIE